MDILKYRLQNQQISSHAFEHADDVVKWFGAIQAQDYAGAKWALGLRVSKATDDVIEKLLSAGKIIRTHVMRPTWHFVHREDLRWMLQLTGERVKATMASRERQLGLNDKIFNKCNDIIVKALEGNKQLTRPELMSLLNKAGINTDEYRSGHIAIHAELDGLICSGARRGNQFTYRLIDNVLPETSSIDRDEALGKLALRYFTAHGPATIHDFAWWSGLTLTDVKRAIEIADKHLAFQELDGLIYWFATDMPGPKSSGKGIYLLPNYDEYTVGYANRDALAAAAGMNARDNILFSNVIVIDGKVKGTWKRSLRKDSIAFEYVLPKKLSKQHEQALRASAKRYARFFGLKLSE